MKSTATRKYGKKNVVRSGVVIYLENKSNNATKDFSIDYLNQKLAYFYNNGGPIMDL
jgi:hypothetical protein